MTPAGRSGGDVERTLDDLEGEIDAGPSTTADPRSAIGAAVVPATSPPDPDLPVLLRRFFDRDRATLAREGVVGIGVRDHAVEHGGVDPDGVWWGLLSRPDLGGLAELGFTVRAIDASAYYRVVAVAPPDGTPEPVEGGIDAIAEAVEAGRDRWRSQNPGYEPQPWARGDE